MKKRLLSLLLILLLSLSTLTAFAEEECVVIDRETLFDLPKANFVTNESAFREYMAEQMLALNTNVDIVMFAIPYAKRSEMCDYLRGMPEGFGLASTIHISYVQNTQLLTAVTLEYNYTDAKKYKTDFNAAVAAANQLLAGVKGSTALTDVTKALLLHDRLAVWTEYDEANYEADTVPDDSYNFYGALVKRVAVCQGYAEAYMYLLDQVGIPCEVVSSTLLGHAWNKVTIGGKKYFVDVTWDDPVWDVTGRVNHNNFLYSQNKIGATGHHKGGYIDYDASDCTDTFYDDYYWGSVKTEFQLLNNTLYYIDSDDAKLKTGGGAILADLSCKWASDASHHYVGHYNRLASDGKTLYYSMNNAIYSFDPATKTSKKIYAPTIPAGSYKNIYGFTYDNGYLVYDLTASPTFTGNTKKTDEFRVKYPAVSETVLGDVTLDGVVNADDLTALARHVARIDSLTGNALDNADVTKDSAVTADDLTQLARYVARIIENF